MSRRAVFLDRDGVIVPDDGVDGDGAPLVPYPEAGPALGRLAAAGWLRVLVTNQPVVARGISSEADVVARHRALDDALRADGGGLDAIEVCFHHPEATLHAYRRSCDCRKPRPGMLLQAAARLDIDLAASVMVGDRMTDLEAGARAGCTGVLVTTGRHVDARISTPDDPIDVTPAAVVGGIGEAVDWILERPA